MAEERNFLITQQNYHIYQGNLRGSVSPVIHVHFLMVRLICCSCLQRLRGVFERAKPPRRSPEFNEDDDPDEFKIKVPLRYGCNLLQRMIIRN